MSSKASSEHINRPPLRDSTNSLNLQSSSSASITSRVSPRSSLRRKSSIRNFRPNADSSESIPTPIDSIFDAVYCGASETVDEKAPWAGTFVTGGMSSGFLVDNYLSGGHLEMVDGSFNLPIRTVHHPTPLETIAEQKSFASLRIQASRDFLLKRSHTTANSKRRRKTSFSLNDISLNRRTSRLFQQSKSSDDDTALPPNLETIYPKLPSHPPPPRLPTPPGLPTFNTPAAAAYILSPPNLRFRDYFRLQRSPAEREWEAQTTELPRGAVMRGKDGVLVRGRWRPGLSGHTGLFVSSRGGLRKHPLNHAPMAESPLSNSGCSGRSTSRDRSDIETTRAELQRTQRLLNQSLPTPPATGIAQPDCPPEEIDTVRCGQFPVVDERRTRWDKFAEVACLVCCGAEKLDEVSLPPRMVHLEHGRLGTVHM